MKKTKTKKENWKLVFTRSDMPKWEVICPHGVGHHAGVHGCHMSIIQKEKSCCSDCPPNLWIKVTNDFLPKVIKKKK